MKKVFVHCTHKTMASISHAGIWGNWVFFSFLFLAQLFPCSEIHANKEHRSLHPVKHLQIFTTNELEDKFPAAVSTLGVKG